MQSFVCEICFNIHLVIKLLNYIYIFNYFININSYIDTQIPCPDPGGKPNYAPYVILGNWPFLPNPAKGNILFTKHQHEEQMHNVF